MAHFAIICPDCAGHLLPIGSIGSELVRRGHRVTVVAGSRAAAVAEQLGLEFSELAAAGVPRRDTPLLRLAFSACGLGWPIGLRNTFRWRAEVTLQRAPQILQDLAVDGVIVDQTVSAGGTVAERLDLPFVTLCSALPWNQEPGLPPVFTHWSYAPGQVARWRNRLGIAAWRWYIRPELRTINRYRRDWKLPPLASIDQAFSPLAQISQLCAEFDFPRREHPPHFQYAGALAGDRRGTEPDFPWDRLDARPLIFASLGTIPGRANLHMYRTILAGCEGLDAQLVLAQGRWHDKQGGLQEPLGPVPDNALVVEFAPQLALLDRAALLITHAGVNTVAEAIARGVPMVALPRMSDQPGMASRIAYAGIGLRGSFRHCTPDQLREMVQRVLTEPGFRQRVCHMQQALRAAGGAPRAAEIVEQALLTRRPVLREGIRSEAPTLAQELA